MLGSSQLFRFEKRPNDNPMLFSGRLLIIGLLLVATPLPGQESGALIDALIRKGILTNQEAEDIRADLVRESNTIPAHAIAGGRSTDRLTVGMRMQAQYASLDTDVSN